MKLCTVCGVVTSRAGRRCTDHARQSNRSRHNAMYSTRAWQRLSARVLRAWRGEHGDWCPAFRRDAHPTSDLTVDQVVPLAAGGARFDIGNSAVLCRSCNSTKGASTDEHAAERRQALLRGSAGALGPHDRAADLARTRRGAARGAGPGTALGNFAPTRPGACSHSRCGEATAGDKDRGRLIEGWHGSCVAGQLSRSAGP